MATRISLLLIVTGLFAAMWSADGPDTRTDAQKQIARRKSSPRSICFSNSGQPKARLTAAVTAVPAQKSIPLPKVIAKGTYLVVDQTGRTERITIGDRAGSSRSQRAQDEYTVRIGENRWHFIRLQLPVEPKVMPRASKREVTLR